MSSASLLKKFQNEVGLTPVPGSSYIHTIRPKSPEKPASEEPQMTEADWDKFEADIDEAFEQLP